jgi:hypothetical protein
MGYRVLKAGILHLLVIALALAACLIPSGLAPVSALSMYDYFTIDYTVSFSQDVIYNNDPFSATVTGAATCIQDLPLTITEAVLSGYIVAQHEDSGDWVTLNPDYTTTINPFPTKEGETIQDSQTVELSFPADSQPGSYQVFGELAEARVKAVLWFNVISYLPRYQSMGSVIYSLGVPGITDLSNYIDWHGFIFSTALAPSADSKCIVELYEGTRALNIEGNPLLEICIFEAEDPPPTPPDDCIILAYDITPKGASFEPPAIVSIFYDRLQIPEGVNEDDLVIAYWDELTEEWTELEDITVDPSANTISAPIYHLSTFAVMAHTAPPSFTVSGLTISPTEAETGGSVTATILVTNSGDLTGNYELTFKVDNNVEETRNITLPGESSKEESFITTASTAGSHEVDINGLTGSFLVTAEAASPTTTITPGEINPDDGVIPPTEPSENTITPETPDAADDTSETDTVSAPGIATTVYELPDTGKSIVIGSDTLFQSSYKTETAYSPWLLAIIYTLYLVLFAGLIYFFRRRRASSTVKKPKDKPNYTVHF